MDRHLKIKSDPMINMDKHLKIGDNSIKEVIAGVNKLHNIVASTLGPKGKNVLIEKSTGPEIINDGVTIAKHVFLQDRLQNMGASLMKMISRNTDDIVSDGTTTSTIIGASIVNNGYYKIQNHSLNTIELKKWLHFYKDQVIDILKSYAKEVNEENLFHVCMISSNNDVELAKLIVDAYKEVGKDGYITVANPISVVPSYKAVKGMVYDRGWLSKMFKTDNKENAFIGKKAKVCYVDGEFRDVTQLISILEKALDDGKNSPVIVMADKFTEEVTALALSNKFSGIQICLLNTPGLVEEQMDYVNDLIAYTGGVVLNQKGGRTLYDITDEDFGYVDFVKVTEKNFEFQVNRPDLDRINDRVEELKKMIEESKAEMFTNLYKVRLSKLQSGIAVIYPGGRTDVEIQDNIERAKDAVGSLKAAVKEGVLPGGGLALFKASKRLQKETKNQESIIAYEIILRSLLSPINQLLSNCGYEDAKIDSILSFLELGADWYGYDAMKEEYCDMFKSGVVDPLLVTVAALENGVSVATSILNMGSSIVLRQEDFEQGKTPLLELK